MKGYKVLLEDGTVLHFPDSKAYTDDGSKLRVKDSKSYGDTIARFNWDKVVCIHDSDEMNVEKMNTNQ